MAEQVMENDLLPKGFCTSIDKPHMQVLLNIQLPCDCEVLLKTIREHLIENALRLSHNNQREAAKLLNMRRTTLTMAMRNLAEWRKEYGHTL